jgi:hypothetical protein
MRCCTQRASALVYSCHHVTVIRYYVCARFRMHSMLEPKSRKLFSEEDTKASKTPDYITHTAKTARNVNLYTRAHKNCELAKSKHAFMIFAYEGSIYMRVQMRGICMQNENNCCTGMSCWRTRPLHVHLQPIFFLGVQLSTRNYTESIYTQA